VDSAWVSVASVKATTEVTILSAITLALEPARVTFLARHLPQRRLLIPHGVSVLVVDLSVLVIAGRASADGFSGSNRENSKGDNRENEFHVVVGLMVCFDDLF